MTSRVLFPGNSAPLLASPGTSGAAQDFPVRSVRLVVPFAPDGETGVLAEHFQAESGQSLVADLGPGAGGTLGAAQVDQSVPDGLTMIIGTPGTHAPAPASGRTAAAHTP